jgi:hypothetical protein
MIRCLPGGQAAGARGQFGLGTRVQSNQAVIVFRLYGSVLWGLFETACARAGDWRGNPDRAESI